MRIKGGDLVNLRHGKAQFLGQSAQVGGAKMTILILDQVEKLDQQIRAAGTIAQKRAHVVPCLVLELAALGRVTPLAFARFPNAFAIIQRHMRTLPSGTLRAGHPLPFLRHASAYNRSFKTGNDAKTESAPRAGAGGFTSETKTPHSFHCEASRWMLITVPYSATTDSR